VDVLSIVWAGAAAALAPGPHCALRKSFHFRPLRVPAVFAAWYFALHSAVVRPFDVSAPAAAPPCALFMVVAAGFAGLLAVPASLAAAHSALRNWFQFMPFRVPALLAA